MSGVGPGVPSLSLAPLGFLELDPPALLEVAGEAGFASVTLRTAPAVVGGAHYPLAPGGRELRRVEAAVRACGVGVLQVELITLDRATDVASYRPMLEAGAALGATRVVVSGDDPDHDEIVPKLAEIADLAAQYGLTVDVEFMPFRPLATLGQALDAVARAGRENAAVMVDALHLARSGGTPAELAAADPGRVGVLQLCDARPVAPPAERLAEEARGDRLLPGEGGLPLRDLLDALPSAQIACEVPLAGPAGARPPVERARAIHTASVAVLRGER